MPIPHPTKNRATTKNQYVVDVADTRPKVAISSAETIDAGLRPVASAIGPASAEPTSSPAYTIPTSNDARDVDKLNAPLTHSYTKLRSTVSAPSAKYSNPTRPTNSRCHRLLFNESIATSTARCTLSDVLFSSNFPSSIAFARER
mmetsp:Transcript_10115/g.32543  ORF Transcript_10115/g.32543 Transcript_10115/m.32543 type:complete len:145 (+) Transcript_10115:472-906(+)